MERSLDRYGRMPGEIHYEKEQKCNVELYEGEIKILKNLIQAEKSDLKNRQEDTTQGTEASFSGKGRNGFTRGNLGTQ